MLKSCMLRSVITRIPTILSWKTTVKRRSLGSSGATNHHRVDWLTPDGQCTWGDGRTFVLGTLGTIELRSFCDVARDAKGELMILVDAEGEHRIECAGRVGLPFYGDLIRDCLQRTEHAQTQAHAFKAAELCLRTQAAAKRLPTG